jgi:oligopeptide/dipeptide ABC transporter ATP-binding protein
MFDGRDLSGMNQRQLRPLRSNIQMVFQEPHASLNPHMSIAQNIQQPLVVQKVLGAKERRDRVRELLAMVQLGDRHMALYPHNLSAGQAQRVGIARAIATDPKLIVLDEPTSLLDIAIRSDILDLLNRVKEEIGVSYIFISHDLAAVRSVCSRIAIMYLGKIIETSNIEDIFALQRHPYSKALLASVLQPNPDAPAPDVALAGEIPSPVDLPAGCYLYSRCPLAQAECALAQPPLEQRAPDWWAACYRSADLVREQESGLTRSDRTTG